MAAPPPLLTVFLSLPSKLQALPHIPQLVNDFLLPTTIDAAVYKDLQRVLRVYEAFRPYTVGAIDGAAARGRLDILHKLYHLRDEGCSRAAFIGAATNGHLLVLEWLYGSYPHLRDAENEIIPAATHGHTHIAEFLIYNANWSHDAVMPALVEAAANGHVATVELFLRFVYDTDEAFAAAAANGHVRVLELFPDDPPIRWALQKAIGGGHIDAIQFLLQRANSLDASFAFENNVEAIGTDLLKLILERCNLDEHALGVIFREAAEFGRSAIVEVVLEKCSPLETSCLSWTGFWYETQCNHFGHSQILLALHDAARGGHLEMINTLLDTSSPCVGGALRSAVYHDQWEVAERLLLVCEDKQLKETRIKEAIDLMLSRAAATGNVEIVQLILSKCGDLSIDEAFDTAVYHDCLQVVEVLVEKTTSSNVLNGLIDAVVKADVEMVKLLLDFVGQTAIEEALEETASSGSVEISSMLLARCEAGSHRHIFLNATVTNNTVVVQLLVDQMDQCSINRALTTAAGRGYTDIINVLLDRSQSSACSYALEVAALVGNCDIIELLQSRCDSDGIANAVARARVVGCDDVVKLLCNKKARFA